MLMMSGPGYRRRRQRPGLVMRCRRSTGRQRLNAGLVMCGCCDASHCRSGGSRVVDVANESSKFVERPCLHEDVVLGKQQRGDLGELSDRRTVCVRDDGPQLVEGVVQIVHTASLSGVDAQSDLSTWNNSQSTMTL